MDMVSGARSETIWYGKRLLRNNVTRCEEPRVEQMPWIWFVEPVLTHPGMGKAAVETYARGQLNFVLRKCYGYGFGNAF